MVLDGLGSDLREIWQNKPGAIILLILGFLIFVFIVIDTWFHRRRRKRSRR